ncbi:MAG: BrnT family toxin [Bryobacterales bacterium]|nr:BrnT family toxin [Bryobacterales bacterium]
MAAFRFEFEWDPVKADANLAKHGLDFERAATVFLDPLAVTIADEDHSETEVRWITLGKDAGGQYALVIHTFEWMAGERGRVRVISARRPTKAEIRDYEEQS